MKKRMTLVSAFVLSGFVYAADRPPCTPDRQATSVSPEELITVGEKFEGWKVRVIGVAHFDFEHAMLFSSRERYDIFDTSSSLILDVFSEGNESFLPRERLMQFAGKFVAIEGVYAVEPRSRPAENEVVIGSEYAGVISEINCIKEIAPKRLDVN